MRILPGAAAVLVVALGGPAWAQSVGAMIQGFGFVGTWANDCSRDLDKHQVGYKMIFEIPEQGPPTRTIISSDGAKKTTIKADILGAQSLGTNALVIQAKVTSADRDGNPLPASAWPGLNQSFEKTGPNVLYVKGSTPVRLERCPG